MADQPYALFGGYNSTQTVGEMKTFKNYPNRLGTWALLGQGINYGKESVYNESDTDL